jgi:energy-converting hydrogenase Eha subunit A
MMSPSGMAIAAITVMLWILWSDTIRPKRPSQFLYTVRIALYLIVSGIFVLNLVRYPRFFIGFARPLAVVAAVIGVLGAIYFGRRLVRRA